MKSGGPWNLRGLHPETRETARNAARRSGMSVGEWLNSVIQRGDEDHGEPMRSANYQDDDDDGWRGDYRPDCRRAPHEPRWRRDRDHERGISIEHEAALAREEFGEGHA